MRGFYKAAAFLSSTFVSAFTIPESSALAVKPSGAVVEYLPSEVSLTFVIDNVRHDRERPNFIFRVQAVDQACGESNIQLNGQKLETRWDGTTASGNDYLDHFEGQGATWTVTCLYESNPTDGGDRKEHDVVHLLSLRFGQIGDNTATGFTISYRQNSKPAVVRFLPTYVDFEGSRTDPGLWRVPSTQFDSDIWDSSASIHQTPSFESWRSTQKSLGQSWQALKSSVQTKLHDWLPKCPSKSGKPKQMKAASLPGVADVGRILDASEQAGQNFVAAADATPSVDNSNQSPTAITSLLASIDPVTSSTTGESSSASHFMPLSHSSSGLLQILVPSLALFSLFGWLLLRCKDPRSRAEWAALKEERRNKRWFRRAARKQKVKNWVWNLRLRLHLASEQAISWDEKRSRIAIQEDVLENVMKDDIQALRDAHRAVSNVTAAEEGRNDYAYDFESSDRRRSTSTLPGYESEGSQPPLLDTNGHHVVAEFLYRRTQRGFTPDSSVISTSPRISRDGTNSDVENEKIEAINLGDSRPVEHNY